MKNLEKEKQELLSAIQYLGFESLRYSIFNENGPGEWEVVIEYDDSSRNTMCMLRWIELVEDEFSTLQTLQKQKRNF